MRFTGGSVTEEKRRNGKSFNPKHWRICLSFTYDEEGNLVNVEWSVDGLLSRNDKFVYESIYVPEE